MAELQPITSLMEQEVEIQVEDQQEHPSLETTALLGAAYLAGPLGRHTWGI